MLYALKPVYEKFFKVKKPKYTKGIRTIIQDGLPFTLEDNFEYRLKLDHEKIKGLDAIKVKRMLSHAIINSLDVLEAMKTKLKDFDANLFERDLLTFFEGKGLVEVME